MEPIEVNRKKGVALVLTAGIFWSFAGLAVRLIEHAVEWQILFYRSTTLVGFLCCYILVARRGKFVASIQDGGTLAIKAGFWLSLAFVAWIYALTNTTVANALFMLSTAPFLAAIIGRLILKEVVLPSTWFFVALTTAGVGVMVVEGLQLGTLFGTAMGLCAAIGFALFAVQLRQGRQTDLVPFVLWAGFFASLWAGAMILLTSESFGISMRDWLLCASMGVFQVGVGLVIFFARLSPSVSG